MFFRESKLSAAEFELHERALRAAQVFRSAQSELLDIVREVDRTKLFARFALGSTFSYCVEKLGLSEDMACAFIQVGRKAEKVPELAVAVQEGLSISKAKRIVPLLEPATQAVWIERAKELPYRELEREIAKERPQAAVVEQVRAVAENRVKLELGLSEALLAQLRQAQDMVSSKTRKAATLEETLAALLEAFLPAEPKASIPAAARREVAARDQGRCQVKLPSGKPCGATRWVQVHHIQPRALGGGHELANLITLCAAHHRQLHPPRGGSELTASNPGASPRAPAASTHPPRNRPLPAGAAPPDYRRSPAAPSSRHASTTR